ncbi:MAG: DUF177 domain-containing protein [Acidobacteriota bacterium]|nr:DUF177 domain-containing protein [Acidobacteriota bacterium]
MIVDLVTIRDADISFDFILKPDEIDLDSDEAKLKHEIKVKGSLKKGIAQTDVQGNIDARVEIECSRCLQTAEQSLEFPFNATFVTPEHYTDEKEAELKADDLDVSIIEDDKIDLKELVREQILLAIPVQVLCREDCRGLCQKCGASRNLIDCNCEEKEIDPRWQSLRELEIKK